MLAIYEMSAEEKLFAKKLTLLLIDAIDGPINAPEPWVSDPDLFGERKAKFGVSDFYMTEYEARRDAGSMISDLHPTFVFCCEVVDADPYRIRERFIDGDLDRAGLIRYYTMLNRD